MPSYATITGTAKSHDGKAIVAKVVARPLVTFGVLRSSEGGVTIGQVTGSIFPDGSLRDDESGAVGLRIPLDTEPANPWWDFHLEVPDQRGGLRSVPLGRAVVTVNMDLDDLLDIDLTAIDSNLIADAQLAAAAAAASAAEASRIAGIDDLDGGLDEVLPTKLADPADPVGAAFTASIAPYRTGDLSPIAGALALLDEAGARKWTAMLTGDSIAEGYGASVVAERWADRFQAALRASHGPATQGLGYLPARYVAVSSNGSPFPSPYGYNGTWDEANSYWGPGFKGRRGSPGSQFFTPRVLTSVRPLFIATTPNDVVRCALDNGESGQTFTVGGGVVEGHTVWNSVDHYGLTTSGTHGFALDVISGNPVFAGAIFCNGDENSGVMVVDGSQSGAKAFDLAGNTNPNSHWIDCLGTFVTPDLLINTVVVNDSRTNSGGYSVAQYKTYQQLYINKVRAKVPNVPILFAPPFQHDQDDQLIEPWSDYLEALRELAEANPYVAVFPMSNYMSVHNDDPWALAVDGVHPSNRGHRLMGRMATSLLENYPVAFSTAPSA